MEYNAVLVFQGTDVNKCDRAMATPSKVHLPGGPDPSTTILSSWTAGPPHSNANSLPTGNFWLCILSSLMNRFLNLVFKKQLSCFFG